MAASFDDMEIPVPCPHCGKDYDIIDGVKSVVWYPRNAICPACADKEQEEIEKRDTAERIKLLRKKYLDAKQLVHRYKKQLKNLGIVV